MRSKRLWHLSKGAIAQLGERVLCKHEVVGSIPSGSTISLTGNAGQNGLALTARAVFEFVREILFCMFRNMPAERCAPSGGICTAL